jgi:hypothetical protein
LFLNSQIKVGLAPPPPQFLSKKKKCIQLATPRFIHGLQKLFKADV